MKAILLAVLMKVDCTLCMEEESWQMIRQFKTMISTRMVFFMLSMVMFMPGKWPERKLKEELNKSKGDNILRPNQQSLSVKSIDPMNYIKKTAKSANTRILFSTSSRISSMTRIQMLKEKQSTACQDLKRSFIAMIVSIRFYHKKITTKIVWLQKRKLIKYPTSTRLKKSNSSNRFPNIWAILLKRLPKNLKFKEKSNLKNKIRQNNF